MELCGIMSWIPDEMVRGQSSSVVHILSGTILTMSNGCVIDGSNDLS